jgi:hypothetical protein
VNIKQFLLLEQISRPTYGKLRKRGLTPDEGRTPGSSKVNITDQAIAAYRKRLKSREVQQILKREAELRSLQAKHAAKKSVLARAKLRAARAKR